MAIGVTGLACVIMLYHRSRQVAPSAPALDAPVLSVPAKVTAKKNEMPLAGAAGGTGKIYRVTFQLGTATKELVVPEKDFKQLTEGMAGTLVFQEKRFLGFEPAKVDSVGEKVGSIVAEPSPSPAIAPKPAGFCPYCGSPVQTDFRFCPRCGKAQPERAAIA